MRERFRPLSVTGPPPRGISYRREGMEECCEETLLAAYRGGEAMDGEGSGPIELRCSCGHWLARDLQHNVWHVRP